MWTTSFLRTISVRVCIFSNVCFWYPWQTSDGYSYTYLCDLFCSCCLWVCFWACTILVFTLDLQYILHSVVVIPHTVLFTRDCFGYIKTSWNIRGKKRKEGKESTDQYPWWTQNQKSSVKYLKIKHEHIPKCYPPWPRCPLWFSHQQIKSFASYFPIIISSMFFSSLIAPGLGNMDVQVSFLILMLWLQVFLHFL